MDKTFLEENYTFTILVIVLTAALFYFGDSYGEMIVGAFLGALTQPKRTK